MNAPLDLSGRNLVDLLDLLEPLPDPPPVSMWPQTPGWLVLGIGLGFIVIRAVLRRQARARREAYRKAALTELARAGDDVARIAAILRRAALAGYPRAEVAGLTGAEWLGFLAATCPGLDTGGKAAQILISAPYRGGSGDAGVAALARQWIRDHRRAAP